MTTVMNFIRRVDNADLLSVQTGEDVIAAGTTSENVAVTALVKNKSLLFYTYKNAGTDTHANKTVVVGRINTTTQLVFEVSDVNASDITINWQVIEFKPTSSLTVQHFYATAINADTNITIAAVNLSHAFPIVYMTTNATLGTRRATVYPEFTSTTNLKLSCVSYSDNTYAAQVVEYDKWDVAVYTDTMDAADTSENTPITGVTLAESMLFGYGKSTIDSNLDGSELAFYGFSSVTNILTEKPSTSNGWTLIFYVVETPTSGQGSVICRHDQNEVITNSNNTGNLTIAAVTIANTALKTNVFYGSAGPNYSTTSIEANRLFIELKLSSTTNLRQERGGTTDDMHFGVAVYDFTNS